MKSLIVGLLLLVFSVSAYSANDSLEKYISSFDYEARQDMKINSKSLITLLKEEKAQLIDIRFKEEYEAWSVGPAKSIPLHELPNRLSEIETGKIIVTACPHKDRAIIAMVYLRSKGIQAKYLTDGLIGMAENLRGDNAEDFIFELKANKNQILDW